MRSVSKLIDMERLIFTLASDLKSRRMTDEVDQLRRLYVTHKRRVNAPRGVDDITAIEWAAMVGLPPFEHVFLAQPRYHKCPCWGQDRDRGRTQNKHFPASASGGPALTAHWCKACGAHWVVAGEEKA